MKKIDFIVPVFNEEAAVELFYSFLDEYFSENIDETKYSYGVIFVNDGSKDNTWQLLQDLFQENSNVTVVDFSRNFGKENALFAGIEICKGDIVIPMDVDLQDPLSVVGLMLKKYEEGYDVVLAKRRKRENDSFFKRKSAESFYNFYNYISKVKLEPNVGDFRLMDKKVVDEIKKLPENQIFMKGVFNWVGFKTAIVEYDRAERVAGISKFNGFKLWNLALEGITSFSTAPIRMWLYIGSAIALISFVLGIKVIIEKFFFGIEEHGYASLIVSIFFLGGIQLIGIGILGEYIGRIYMETKRRPKYIINKTLSKDE